MLKPISVMACQASRSLVCLMPRYPKREIESARQLLIRRRSGQIKRITLALSPAALPKRGSSFDCAIALALLAAAEELSLGRLEGAVALGELTLDGRIKSVPGILPALRAAALHGIERALIPSENYEEGSLVPGIELIHFGHLRELIAWLRGSEYLPGDRTIARSYSQSHSQSQSGARTEERESDGADFSDIAGQEAAKEALEIGAVGGHHLAMVGPPGVGKSMLAARIPTILPSLSEQDALDVTSLHSIAGKISPDSNSPLITTPPFIAPHHTISRVGLIGGGSATISPGACSLAHRGILFLDEAPEISRQVIEALREPMELGEITLTRLGRSATFPAHFTLVLASNPCPCGWAIGKAKRCTCSPLASRRYREKLSGPILDRIDLRIELEPLSQGDLMRKGESSADIKSRVESSACEVKPKISRISMVDEFRDSRSSAAQRIRTRASRAHSALSRVRWRRDHGSWAPPDPTSGMEYCRSKR